MGSRAVQRQEGEGELCSLTGRPSGLCPLGPAGLSSQWRDTGNGPGHGQGHVEFGGEVQRLGRLERPQGSAINPEGPSLVTGLGVGDGWLAGRHSQCMRARGIPRKKKKKQNCGLFLEKKKKGSVLQRNVTIFQQQNLCRNDCCRGPIKSVTALDGLGPHLPSPLPLGSPKGPHWNPPGFARAQCQNLFY